MNARCAWLLCGWLCASRAMAQDAGALDAGVADAGDADASANSDAGSVDASVEDAAVPASPPPPSVAAGHEPELQVRRDPSGEIMTGDLVTLIVTARAVGEDDILLPQQDFEPFDVLSTDRDTPSAENDRRFEFRIQLLALRPGTFTLPPIQLRVVTDGLAMGVAQTEALTIEVQSVLGNEPNAQPKPASDPVPVFQEDYTLAWVLGILGALLLTAVATWFVARWWARRPKAAPPPPPPRPAWEIAFEKLNELRGRLPSMWQAGESVTWVDAVNDAIREYLGARYGFEGLESTTDEILARLRRAHLQDYLRSEIEIHLGECDLVKFAKAAPDEASCEQLIAGAIHIVRQTAPIPQPLGTPPLPFNPPPTQEPPSISPGGRP